MNSGARDQYFPSEMQQFPQYPPGWIYPGLPSPYMCNDRGNRSPSTLITSSDSLPESLQFSENSAALTTWRDVLFTDFDLKCDCSFPEKFFITGRFQVGFVQNKSEIVP